MCMQKFRCTRLRIKKALGIFRELITTTTTTTAAFGDPRSGSKKEVVAIANRTMLYYTPYYTSLNKLKLSQNMQQTEILLNTFALL